MGLTFHQGDTPPVTGVSHGTLQTTVDADDFQKAKRRGKKR